ncbi:AAA family ATPase [Geminisphaera colitermitum]|uniref:AAA family ATPase n=1 Tax=Geminisphaera colitermitum TaxID=1148786 RepID=UPI000693EA0E|nr:AAA family ATPase [Geminisphaera colitermitum]
MNPLAQEIDTLIRARYPILYLVTNEETRAQTILHDIAARRQKKVFEWSHTTGLVPAGTNIQSQKNRNSPTRDPLIALDQVIDQVDPAIFLFKDFHPYLARNNHAVIRKLKEIALQLKSSYKTLVILSPVVEIPAEIDKEITLLNLPLPTRSDLGHLLDRILADVKQYPAVRIDLDAPARERLLNAALGLTLNEAENVFAKIIVKDQRLTSDHVADVFSEKQQIIRKSGLLEYYATDATFATVGGLPILKDWLQKRALAFSEQARAFGLPAPKGVLMLGVQGCGKSLCAKAVSHLWQLPLLRFDIGRMFGSLVGSSEENVRKAIAVAESVAPAILWVDEIDKAFVGTKSSGMTDGGTTARVFGTFLTWLSEKTAPVFVVATANDISQLPPELLRKGRLDEIFFVDLPTPAERTDILRIHLQKRSRSPETFDLPALTATSQDFSGAEIEQAVISALYDAFYDGTDLTTAHILEALRQTVPLSKTMDEHLRRLRAWADGRARHASRATSAPNSIQSEIPTLEPTSEK